MLLIFEYITIFASISKYFCKFFFFCFVPFFPQKCAHYQNISCFFYFVHKIYLKINSNLDLKIILTCFCGGFNLSNIFAYSSRRCQFFFQFFFMYSNICSEPFSNICSSLYRLSELEMLAHLKNIFLSRTACCVVVDCKTNNIKCNDTKTDIILLV